MTKGREQSADIPTFLFGFVISWLKEQGKDPRGLIAGVNLSLDALADHETRVTFNEATTLFRNAVSLSEDPGFGLTLGITQRLDDWGLLGYALATCRTALDGMKLAQKYSGAATNIVEAAFEERDEGFAILMRARQPLSDLLPFAIEEAFSSTLMVLRQRTGREVRPLSVELAYGPPDYAARYRSIFKCAPRFNQSQNAMVFSRSDVLEPLPSHNPVTARLAEQLCEQDLKSRQAEAKGDMAHRVYREILKNPGNFPSSEKMAQMLGMSRSTLSRALKKLDTSYQALLDEARRRLAIEYLQTSGLSLEEIAWLVGFSDAGNFHRAFRKWTGHPPSHFRP